jgi:hypothetical protein
MRKYSIKRLINMEVEPESAKQPGKTDVIEKRYRQDTGFFLSQHLSFVSHSASNRRLLNMDFAILLAIITI